MPIAATGTVHVVNNFPQLIAEWERKAQHALAVAAREGAAAGHDVATQRHRTGAEEALVVGPVEATATGFEVFFGSRPHYSWWQEKGTSRGITPLHFLRAGRNVGRHALMRELRR